MSMAFLCQLLPAQKDNTDCTLTGNDEIIPASPLFLKKQQLLKRLPLTALKNVRKIERLADSVFIRPLNDIDGLNIEIPIRYQHIIPLVFHSIKRDDGTGGIPDGDFYLAVEQLNENFRDINFKFEICLIREDRSDFLYNAKYYGDLEGKLPSDPASFNAPYKLLDVEENNVKNVINIYTVPSNNEEDGRGGNWSNFPRTEPWRQHIIMRQSSILGKGNTVLSHELGHWFGLRHTFSSTELVVRTGGNCSTAGDKICDTPADPQPLPNEDVNVDADCNYILERVDANGVRYTPDTRNFMSYYGKCRNRFSNDQEEKMLNAFLLMEDQRGYELHPCLKPGLYPASGAYPSPFEFEIINSAITAKAETMGLEDLKVWYKMSAAGYLMPVEGGLLSWELEPNRYGTQRISLTNTTSTDKTISIVARSFYESPGGGRAGREIDTSMREYVVYKRSGGPSRLTATRTFSDYIRLNWTPLFNARSYIIYVGSGPTRLTRIATVNAIPATYSDRRYPGSGDEIRYYIRAILQNGRETELSNPATGKFTIAPLEFSVSRRASDNAVQLDWGMPSFLYGPNLNLEFIVYRNKTNNFSSAGVISRHGLKYRTVVIGSNPVQIPDGYVQQTHDLTAGTVAYYYWVICRNKSNGADITPPGEGKRP